MNKYAILIVRPQHFQINLADTDVRVMLPPVGGRFNLFPIKQKLKEHWVNAEADFRVEKLGEEDFLVTWLDDNSQFRLVPVELAAQRIFHNAGNEPVESYLINCVTAEKIRISEADPAELTCSDCRRV